MMRESRPRQEVPVSASLWQRLRQTRSRWAVRAALLLLVGIGVFAWFAWERSQSRLTIQNRAGQPIDVQRITVDDQPSTFRDVAHGTARSAPFAVRSDSRFKLEVRLADGTQSSAHGLVGEQHHFLVLPRGQVTTRPAQRRQ